MGDREVQGSLDVICEHVGLFPNAYQNGCWMFLGSRTPRLRLPIHTRPTRWADKGGSTSYGEDGTGVGGLPGGLCPKQTCLIRPQIRPQTPLSTASARPRSHH